MSLSLCGGVNLGDLAITRRLGGQATVIFLGNLFTLAVGLPLQVYVARVLGAEGLGTFSLLEAGVATLSGLLALGIAPTLVKYIPEHLEKREYGCIRKLLRGGALILAAAGSLHSVIGSGTDHQ